MRALALAALSLTRSSSGPWLPAIDISSSPLVTAPIGLIRSWQMRDPISAARLSICWPMIFLPKRRERRDKHELNTGTRHAGAPPDTTRLGHGSGAIQHRGQGYR